MIRLFAPLTIGKHQIRNRIVRAPLMLSNGLAGGFISAHHVARYATWSKGGVGLILSEPLTVVATEDVYSPGIYHDALIPDLRRICGAVEQRSTFIPLLTYPELPLQQLAQSDIALVLQKFEQAAWRARAAGFAGFMLDAGPRTLLHQLYSPRFNQRRDMYGAPQRIQAAVELVERLRQRFGADLLLGYRMVIDELRPDGVGLQESRVAARRLAAAGVQLFDLVVGDEPTQPVAHFPGWQIPLVAALRSFIDVPVIVNGAMSDPELAEMTLLEGSADLIGIGQALMQNPHWPLVAAQTLQISQAAS